MLSLSLYYKSFLSRVDKLDNIDYIKNPQLIIKVV